MKKTVLLLFGGKSPEHEISVKTAYNVAKAINQDVFVPILLGVSKEGSLNYLTIDQLENLAKNHLCVSDENAKKAAFHGQELQVYEEKQPCKWDICSLMKYWKNRHSQSLCKMKIDVVFPLLHGVSGEDGIPQGFLNMLNLPFVGNDVKASSICMDKDVTKKLLHLEDIPVVDSITLHEDDAPSIDEIVSTLGLPVFVKAAEQGSSIGTYKASTTDELITSIKKAFAYGPKVIVEKGLVVREIEIAVLGNGGNVKVSDPGEIIPNKKHGFYSYDAKYMDPDGAEVLAQASLMVDQITLIKTYAEKAFRVLGCNGLARIDFFIDEHKNIYLNEINTMPGFTNISMYPKLWMNEGIAYQDLITQLIGLAFEQFNKKKSYILV